MNAKPAMAVNEKALARRVKDHVTGRRHEFFAIVHPGFEEAARRELRELGIRDPVCQGPGGIAFSGKLEDGWRANLGAGIPGRILMRLDRFKATGFAEFRARLEAIPWELHVAGRACLRFAITAKRSRLWHEGKLEEEANAAITSRLAAFGRPVDLCGSGEDGNGQVQHVFVRLEENRCQVSLDMSGELLHKRGLGKTVEAAPLRETLACAILQTAAIHRFHTLVDPFCGSGTFALEAGAIFSGRPVNLDRAFAFQGWPSFKPARFQHLKDEMAREFREKAPAGTRRIYCSDIDPEAVATARQNLEQAGLAALVEVDQADFFRLHPPAGDPAEVLLVMNPPYGARQEHGGDIASLFRRIGEKVRRDYSGCGYAIIVPGLEVEKALGLAHDQKILFHNGGIPVALLIHSPITVTSDA